MSRGCGRQQGRWQAADDELWPACHTVLIGRGTLIKTEVSSTSAIGGRDRSRMRGGLRGRVKKSRVGPRGRGNGPLKKVEGYRGAGWAANCVQLSG